MQPRAGLPPTSPFASPAFLFLTFLLCGAVISTACGKSYRTLDGRRMKQSDITRLEQRLTDGMQIAQLAWRCRAQTSRVFTRHPTS
jgi:hypothetical protein